MLITMIVIVEQSESMVNDLTDWRDEATNTIKTKKKQTRKKSSNEKKRNTYFYMLIRCTIFPIYKQLMVTRSFHVPVNKDYVKKEMNSGNTEIEKNNERKY